MGQFEKCRKEPAITMLVYDMNLRELGEKNLAVSELMKLSIMKRTILKF